MIAGGRLAGKVAIVTGGASGIGRVTARTLAGEGAALVLADIDAAGAHDAADELVGAGYAALAVRCDIGVERDVIDLVAATERAFGRVLVLDNNAAITSREHQAADGAIADMDVDTWDRTMRIDLRGTMLCCKHVVPSMLAAGGGSIINISSNAALAGDVTLSAYAAAKAAVHAVTMSVACAYGRGGVRCNTVSPASIKSPSAMRIVPSEVLAEFERHVLLPRLGDPQDVANLVLWLASDESSFVTGQLLRVDGGALSHLPHTGYLAL